MLLWESNTKMTLPEQSYENRGHCAGANAGAAVMTGWRLCAVAVLPVILFLGGCVSNPAAWTRKVTHQDVKMPTQCTGWEKQDIKGSTRYYLMRKDPRLLVDIDAHNLRGRNLGCWK